MQLCRWALLSSCAVHLISAAPHSMYKMRSWWQYPFALAFCLLYLAGLQSSYRRNCFLMCTSVYKIKGCVCVGGPGKTLSIPNCAFLPELLLLLNLRQPWSVPSQPHEKFGGWFVGSGNLANQALCWGFKRDNTAVTPQEARGGFVFSFPDTGII